MLFNSHVFIFAFLPLTLLAFFVLGARQRGLAAGWLVAASLFFYGWWNPQFVGLLLSSIAANYLMALAIAKADTATRRKAWLTLGVVGNLLLLGYYKYADFFIRTLKGALYETWLPPIEVTLPLGISFFTFTQIAFLVDVSRGLVREHNPLHYGLFVTYYPHLLAGPVLHHKEMMPQFANASTYRPDAAKMASGLTLFGFGLFKKVVIADTCGPWATEIFDRAQPDELTFLVAWVGAISYALQIYFDFSGYTDMAIGVSRLFGIELPINFDSPYKSRNIIEFWRRWHMTLSRFLRDYLYIPLGGNRLGPVRRHVNLMLTMLLGGLWHGAGWTFVIWGGLHGLYLVLNHGWHAICERHALARRLSSAAWLSGSVTFVAVTVAWVFFRAKDVARAQDILLGMFGTRGVSIPAGWAEKFPGVAALTNLGLRLSDTVRVEKLQLIVLAGLMAFVVLAPNSQEAIERRWQPNLRWGLVLLAMIVVSVGHMGSRVSEFLYYQF